MIIEKEHAFASNDVFCEIMTIPEICQEFVESLYGTPVSNISNLRKEVTLTAGVQSKSVRLDVTFVGNSTIYDLEMQQSKEKDIVKRARYYQAAIDVNALKEGQKYKELPDTRVIFICRFDPFGLGYPKYTQRSLISECRAWSPDGREVVFLNTRYSQESHGEVSSSILELLDYIHDPELKGVSSNLVKDIQSAVSLYLRTKEDTTMTFTERYRTEMAASHEEGLKQGREEGRKDLLRQLVELGALPREMHDEAKRLGLLQEAELGRLNKMSLD